MFTFDQRYAYSVGRTRVLETRLLDRGKIERLIESRDFEEALKVLSETEYSSFIGNSRSFEDWEKAFQEELARVYGVLREMAPDPDLVGIFLARYDFHNLKVVLKARLAGTPEDMVGLSGFGLLSIEALRKAVSEGDAKGLPDDYREVVARGVALLSDGSKFEGGGLIADAGPTPQAVDILVDREMYGFLIRKAWALRIPFLVELFSKEVDLLNLRIWARSKVMGMDKAFFEATAIPYGTLDVGKLSSIYEQQIETLSELMAKTEYAQVVEEGIKEFSRTGSLSYFERLCDDHLLGYLRKARYIAFGPEPLIAYLLAKEREVQNLRAILLGKLAGLSGDAIRERLRDGYV